MPMEDGLNRLHQGVKNFGKKVYERQNRLHPKKERASKSAQSSERAGIEHTIISDDELLELEKNKRGTPPPPKENTEEKPPRRKLWYLDD